MYQMRLYVVQCTERSEQWIQFASSILPFDFSLICFLTTHCDLQWPRRRIYVLTYLILDYIHIAVCGGLLRFAFRWLWNATLNSKGVPCVMRIVSRVKNPKVGTDSTILESWACGYSICFHCSFFESIYLRFHSNKIWFSTFRLRDLCSQLPRRRLGSSPWALHCARGSLRQIVVLVPPRRNGKDGQTGFSWRGKSDHSVSFLAGNLAFRNKRSKLHFQGEGCIGNISRNMRR